MIPSYSKQAEKYLSSQSDKEYARIKSAVSKLPRGDVKKLQGSKNKYRLRVGDVRVVFTRNGEDIHIETVDSRGQAYKN